MSAEMRDLEQRLSEKALTLSEMADSAVLYTEVARLRSKAEGVDLALSFVQEYLAREGGVQ